MLAVDPDLDLGEAAERVYDVLRFTVVADPDQYMAVLEVLLWVHDSRVSGFLTGQDDWAERIEPEAARRLIQSWGCDAAMLKAPVAEVAST